MISIPLIANDDPRFLNLVQRIVAGNLYEPLPADLFIIRVDHWFDHKWLTFSGKILGALGIHRRERLTIPPFIPTRIVSRDTFALATDRKSYRKTRVPSPHRLQTSRENLRRYISHITESGLFVWFSGDTASAEHGCVMVYTIHGEEQSGWYASFRQNEEWKLHKVEGLSKAELMLMLSRGVDSKQ